MFVLGESFSETDGVRPAVPFFSCRPLELQNFSFVAPQGRKPVPSQPCFCCRPCLSARGLSDLEHSNGDHRCSARPVSQPNADVRGEEASLKYVRAFKALFEVLVGC